MLPPVLLIPFEPTVIVAALRSDKPPLPTCASITPIALPLLLKVAPAAEVIETDGRLTAPVAATEPVPAAMVMPQVSAGELESVFLNNTLPPVVANDVVVPRVTAPSYVCEPLLLIELVFIAVVPVTSSVVKPVTVSVGPLPNTALPSTVKLWLPPASMPFVATVLPFSTVSAPSVTSSLYV